ncbi:MAG: hypothetical protein ACRYFV_20500 [Janthinobacterium lividum]
MQITLTPEEREFVETYQNDVARWAIGKVATSVFGEGIGTALSGPLFNLIGLGTVDKADVYHEEVMAELRKLEGQLSAVQQAVNDVKNAITILGNLISAEALASRLQNLETEANVIRTHFSLLTNDVAALGGAQAGAAALDLFGRLRMPNDTAVALAMRNINSILLTTSAANPGVLQRLLTYLRDIVVNFAATPANYTGKPWPDGTPDGERVYLNTPVLLAGNMHRGSILEVVKVLPVIGELFRRVLAVQVQGLVFLSAAWHNGPQQPELVGHIQMLVAQMGLMKSFYTAAAGVVLQTTVANLRTRGVHGPNLRYRPVYTGSPDGSFPIPFDDAWVLWIYDRGSSFLYVRNPWDYQQQSPPTYMAYRNGYCPNGTFVSFNNSPYTSLPKLEDWPVPAEFNVLNNLPVAIPAPVLQQLMAQHPEWAPV